MARRARAPAAEGGRIHVENPLLRYRFAQVPRPVLRARGLSQEAKALYALLLDYAWNNQSCFPGQKRLGWDLEISVRSVQRALTELRDYGLITWVRRPNNSNLYVLKDFAKDPDLVILGGPDTPFLARRSAAQDAELGGAISVASDTSGGDGNGTPEAPDLAPEGDPEKRYRGDEKDNSDASVDAATELALPCSAPSVGPQTLDARTSVISSVGLTKAQLWAAVLDEARPRCSAAVFSNFLRGTRLVGGDEHGLVVGAPSTFVRNWLEEHLDSIDLLAAVVAVTGRWCDIRFVVQQPD